MSESRRAPLGAVPRATYRVQLHAGFGFDAAVEIVPYLATLGVSHLYVSPILQALPGSLHGYDVVDHGTISAELGGEAGFERLVGSLRATRMGLVVDLVPNHMAIAGEANRWWWDVLEHGPASRFAEYFDVDWDPPESRLRNMILLPVLEDHYGRLLEAGRITLARRDAAIEVRYGPRRFPLESGSLSGIVSSAATRSGSDELAFIGRALGELPPTTSADVADLVRRRQDAAVLGERLAALVGESSIAAALDATLEAINRDSDALDQILELQQYRLAYWRSSSRDLGYRRFFDIDSLIGLRVEREEVFQATHRLILERVAAGDIQGLRIDHPDGLRDPAGYFERLRAAVPTAWIVVEKILEHGELLPDTWPVDGTTGYDFATLATGVLLDPAGAAPLSRHWAQVAPDLVDWKEVSRAARLEAVTDSLGSDLNRLTELLLNICESNRRYRDFTRHDLHEALPELVVAYDVYRTYVRPGAAGVTDTDRGVIDRAVRRAVEGRPDLDPELFGFLGSILGLEVPGALATEFAMRLQQLTPAAFAKGIEDRALYRYLRLTALNEVGSDPSRFGISPDAFHAAMADAARRWPASMLTTSTHDTKRSEDVRARIGRLSEAGDAWAGVADRLAELASTLWPGDARPDGPLLELLAQTLVGAWPISAQRLTAYLVKAAREAKLRTGWGAHDEDYESAVGGLVTACLADPVFAAALEKAAAPRVGPGREASLAQLLLKLTVPGVPDIYQGTELWDDSLVDPDNRRPVDFPRRRALQAGLSGAPTAAEVLARADEGLPKLWVLQTALGLRARRPEAMGAEGSYRPLRAEGPAAAHLLAFLRGEEVVCVVPRLTASLGLAGWAGTRLELPAGSWTDLFSTGSLTGGTVEIGQLLGHFPVALLERSA